MAEADSFDVIVVGSGLASSVFAAAMARSGKRVVHLDERDYYGADWGTLPLRDFFRWVQASSTPVEGAFDYAVRIPAPFQASPFKQCYSASCRAGRGRCYSPTCTTAPWQASWTNALKNDRRFQIDLSSKVFHARGAAVSLLVSSNVSRYLEFNTVEESLIFAGSSFQLVPSSKEGLLTNTTISLRDKRVLSKLLQNVVNFIDGTCDGTNLAFRADGTFDELLTAQGLSLELKDYVIHAMAMVNRTAPWREGVLSTQKYLRSLNVYGSTAFLVSSYGVGELPQAFCRMCAVYAGVYMLATTHTLLRDEAGRLLGVNTPYGTHLAPLLVTPAPPHPTRIAHRTVAILTGPSPRLASRVGSSNGTAVVAVITPRMLPAELAEAGVAVSVVQVGPGAHVCPEGYAVVNLTFASTRTTTARDAALAEHVLRMLARMPGDSNADTEALPTILFAAHFVMPSAADPDSSGAEPSTETDTSTVGEVRPAAATAAPATSGDAPPLAPAAETRHVLLRDAPDASLFADEAIENARILFHKLVGAVEFMPAAPNPEDIVWTESAPDATTEESAASKPASGDAADTAETLVASLVSNAVASGAAAAAHEVEEEHCAARSQEDDSTALAQTEVGKEESSA